jgi:hypothetical protein
MGLTRASTSVQHYARATAASSQRGTSSTARQCVPSEPRSSGQPPRAAPASTPSPDRQAHLAPAVACRQVLAKFMDPGATVDYPADDQLIAVPLSELLPPFTPPHGPTTARSLNPRSGLASRQQQQLTSCLLLPRSLVRIQRRAFSRVPICSSEPSSDKFRGPAHLTTCIDL